MTYSEYYHQPLTQYSLKSDESLRDMFHRSVWTTLDEGKRRDLLQEVVNRETAKNGGRYICNVKFCPLASNVAGEQRGNNIFLNRQMYVEDKLTEEYNGKEITFNLSDSNYNAYETVLHEHQHLKQDMIAAGVIPSDEHTREVFQANGFTTCIVDGRPGSQYMLGVTDYSLYYLNPTELDAFRTSQIRAKDLANEHARKYGEDFASSHYLSYLSKTGYEAKLAEYRSMYGNEHIEKDVENVLINEYQNKNIPVDPTCEKLVKIEMVESQNLIDSYKSQKEQNVMSKEVFTENGFTFEVEESGTVTASGRVAENPASRSGMSSVHPAGYDSQIHDKGHLIAAREGGPAKGYNVSSQDRTLNRGSYKSVENAEVRLANQGYDVQTSKTAYVSNQGSAPDAYMVNDTITSSDGKTSTVNLSFQNASASEQQEWEDICDQYSDYDAYSNPDSLRESMSDEEYTELMESTDNDLSSVRDEYDMENTSQTSSDSYDEAEASTETSTVGSEYASDEYETDVSTEASTDSSAASYSDSTVSESDTGTTGGYETGASGGTSADSGVSSDGGADGSYDGGSDDSYSM